MASWTDHASGEMGASTCSRNTNGKTIAAMDVLAPGIGQTIGGSQREEPRDMPDHSLAERGIDKEHCAPL